MNPYKLTRVITMSAAGVLQNLILDGWPLVAAIAITAATALTYAVTMQLETTATRHR